MCQASHLMMVGTTGQAPISLGMKSTVPLAVTIAAALLTGHANAQPLRASYEVYAGGVAILQLEAEFEVTAGGYRLMTIARTRGLAATFVPGEQTARVAGEWAGMAARPVSYGTDGVWRGRVRRTVLDWPAGDPVVTDIQPTEDEPRDDVSPAQRRGSIDALSALAQMSRLVASVGHCDGQAQVFDGRRRSDYSSRTVGQEMILPSRDASSRASASISGAPIPPRRAAPHGSPPRFRARRPFPSGSRCQADGLARRQP